MELTKDFVQLALQNAKMCLQEFIQDPNQLARVEKLAGLCSEVLKTGGKIYTCGNGGSMCDAMHFAEELTGRFKDDRRPLAAFAFSDPAHLSCVANDYGYDQVFARMAEAFCRPNDLLVGISTSGQSKNVILAVEKAKEKGAKTAALLGKDGGALKRLVDLPIVIPATSAARIQEMHIKIIHIAIALIEHNLGLA